MRRCGGRAGRPFHLDESARPKLESRRFATGLWRSADGYEASVVIARTANGDPCGLLEAAAALIVPQVAVVPSGGALPGRADPDPSGSSRADARGRWATFDSAGA